MNEKKKVAFISVLAAIFLSLFKLIVGLMTGSLGILSEALHSALDLVAAVITFFAIKISDKPADHEHQFGHGKVENLSALIETLLLLITCIWIIYEALHRLISGSVEIEVSVWSYIVVVSSIVIDIWRSRNLKKMAIKHNSQALEADALHFSTDIWSSVVVLVGLVFSAFHIYIADAIAALIVAVIVIMVSYKLGKRAVNALLDATSKSDYQMVEKLLKSRQEILHFHDLRLRMSGADLFIEVNIHLDSDLSLRQAHAITDSIEDEIKTKIQRSNIIIHIEPDDK